MRFRQSRIGPVSTLVGPDSFSFNGWRNGWTVGVGLEYKIARNVSFGVEYSFIELDSDNHNGFTRLGVPFTLRDHDLEVQSVTARLNFPFYRDEYKRPATKVTVADMLDLEGRRWWPLVFGVTEECCSVSACQQLPHRDRHNRVTVTVLASRT